jgi:hypothetical protein
MQWRHGVGICLFDIIYAPSFIQAFNRRLIMQQRGWQVDVVSGQLNSYGGWYYWAVCIWDFNCWACAPLPLRLPARQGAVSCWVVLMGPTWKWWEKHKKPENNQRKRKKSATLYYGLILKFNGLPFCARLESNADLWGEQKVSCEETWPIDLVCVISAPGSALWIIAQQASAAEENKVLWKKVVQYWVQFKLNQEQASLWCWNSWTIWTKWHQKSQSHTDDPMWTLQES